MCWKGQGSQTGYFATTVVIIQRHTVTASCDGILPSPVQCCLMLSVPHSYIHGRLPFSPRPVPPANIPRTSPATIQCYTKHLWSDELETGVIGSALSMPLAVA